MVGEAIGNGEVERSGEDRLAEEAGGRADKVCFVKISRLPGEKYGPTENGRGVFSALASEFLLYY